MATFIKRKNSWRVQINRKGVRLNATFDTRKEAEEWALHAENNIIAGKRPKPIAKKASHADQLVSDILIRYSQEVSPSKRGVRWEKIRLEAMAKFPAFKRPVAEFTPLVLAAWRDLRLETVASSTVNRDLNLLSAIFTHAIKEWMIPFGVNPVHQIQRPKSPPARTRRISLEERKALCEALKWDMVSQPETAWQWVAFSFCLALETAMRKGEILHLRWRDVFLEERYLHLDITKNGEMRNVPISTEAYNLIKLLTPGRSEQFLVPITSGYLDTTFRRARRRVGIEDLHFHDSRREATTQFSKKLSNVLELAAVTGHKNLGILKSYYNPDPSYLAKKLG